MNHLEHLKEQLMVKPDVKERERVAVVIKGAERQRKPKIATAKTIGAQIEEGLTDLGEQISEIQQIEGILPVKIDIEEPEEPKGEKTKRPLIIDKTEEGYDRKTLLKKLAESKKTKVTIRPVLEKEIEPISQQFIEPAVKKAKRIDIKQPLIIEGEDEESPEEFIMKPKKNIEETPKEVIPIIPPKEKKRKTQKPEKGIAILGPEVIVEIGDTDLRKRMPIKNPPINIKVSSYIMNNREIY
jgi:hypothetical protein